MGYINGCNIPHTLRRNNIYYVYFRLPDNHFFRCSIGTDSPRRCSLIISRLMPYISLFRLGKIGREQFLKVLRTMKKLTSQDIDLFVANMNAEILDYVEAIPADARLEVLEGETTPTPVPMKQGSASFFKNYYEDAFFNGGESATETYFNKVLATVFDISGMEKAIADAASKYSVLLHQSQEAQLVFLDRDISGYRQILSAMKPVAALVTPAASAPAYSEPETPALTLAQAVEGFLKFKSDWKPKIRQNNGKYLEIIKEVLGADTSVTKITRRDIKNLLEVVEGLPLQNKTAYKGKTARELIELDDIPEDDLISSKTVKDYLKLCQGLFSTYLTGYQDVLPASPTNNVRYEANSTRYGDYSLTEMSRLVTHFMTLDGWKKWSLLLLAYTGARRSEIISLTVGDVRLDEDSNRHYIMIGQSKTDAGIRRVPLSEHILDMGFLAFLEDRGKEEKIFPEITYANQLSKVFHGIRDDLEIPYLNDFKERRVIHSLRHTFITAASKKHITQLVQRFVGHELSNIGQTQNYTHLNSFTVTDLLPIADSINWQ